MAISAIRGAGIPLPLNQQPFGGLGLTNGNQFQLAAGTNANLNAGNFLISLGLYTQLEVLDPVSLRYSPIAAGDGSPIYVNSDGANYRLSNKTGCAVGARVTTAGSGLTNGVWVNGVRQSDGATSGAVTATPSAGASTWTVIVGGAVNTSATITTAGSGYLYPPQLIISAPQQGGFQATATCTISGGAINAVTITNQGAGYSHTGPVPTVTVVNDPRDTVGSGGVITLALTGTGTITGMYTNNNGTALTSLPTLTFSPTTGSPAATVIMNWTVTAYAVSTAGTTYTGTPMISSIAELVAGSPAYTNPRYETGITFLRPCRIQSALSAGGITATGQIIQDGGFGIQAAPTPLITTNGTTPTVANAATVTLTVGGTTDTVFVQAI